MRELPQPPTADDRVAGYGYALSMLQVEVSDTRVFDHPYRRTRCRFQTRVVDAYTSLTFTFRYKHSTVKQYLKEGLALRTETTINDAYDFDVGRRLRHLPDIRSRGDCIDAGLLEHEANAETARLDGPELTDLVRPTLTDGRRMAALRLGDPRVMALLAAVVMFGHLPAGFSNVHLRRHVAALLSLPLSEYTSARMTCDSAAWWATRVLDPGLARCGPPEPAGPPWQAFDPSLGVLFARANLTARPQTSLEWSPSSPARR